MDKLKWCFNKGVKLVESNNKIGSSYLKMAEDSFGTMGREKDKNLVFSVSAGYYVCYYSLYAILQKIGIKSEIHSCSIEIMKKFLLDFYSEKDIELIEIAFDTRNTLQYYVDRNVNKKDVNLLFEKAYSFFVKSRDIFTKLNEKDIEEIRRKLKEFENE